MSVLPSPAAPATDFTRATPVVDTTNAENCFSGLEVATSTPGARLLFRLIGTVWGLATALLWWSTPEPLYVSFHPLLPQPVIVNGRVALLTPGYVLTAELVRYNDELFAYLMFDYLRHRALPRTSRVLLCFDTQTNRQPYRILLRGQTDLLEAIAAVASMQLPGDGQAGNWELTPKPRVAAIEQQSRLFVSAYNLPVRRKLEDLPPQALAAYLQRFIQFKSTTDRRIRLKVEPVPQPLSVSDAQRLAGDILTIAQFYSLPLELLLGVGAMENNYMDVRGDLAHSVWKHRPAPDDVILERRRGRVRILNDSAGVWQITRETLRYAHSLVQQDNRDYTKLPEHLRPPMRLDVNQISPSVLTTYAGILLRDLLDRFDGNVTLAVSAYNGGPNRPNLQYGEGVLKVAAYARRVLEQSAVLRGESVVRMTWLRAP
jgi:hypothetical protein